MINDPGTPYPSHPKIVIGLDKTTADFLTRKIATSSLTGKSVSRLFCSLLTNQQLDLDSAYLPGRENQVADTISNLTKDDLTSVKYLLRAYPLLASYRRYYPPPELSSRIFNFLTSASEALPGPLRLNGYSTPAQTNA